jgi:hypothetical protein
MSSPKPAKTKRDTASSDDDDAAPFTVNKKKKNEEEAENSDSDAAQEASGSDDEKKDKKKNQKTKKQRASRRSEEEKKEKKKAASKKPGKTPPFDPSTLKKGDSFSAGGKRPLVVAHLPLDANKRFFDEPDDDGEKKKKDTRTVRAAKLLAEVSAAFISQGKSGSVNPAEDVICKMWVIKSTTTSGESVYATYAMQPSGNMCKIKSDVVNGILRENSPLMKARVAAFETEASVLDKAFQQLFDSETTKTERRDKELPRMKAKLTELLERIDPEFDCRQHSTIPHYQVTSFYLLPEIVASFSIPLYTRLRRAAKGDYTGYDLLDPAQRKKAPLAALVRDAGVSSKVLKGSWPYADRLRQAAAVNEARFLDEYLAKMVHAKELPAIDEVLLENTANQKKLFRSILAAWVPGLKFDEEDGCFSTTDGWPSSEEFCAAVGVSPDTRAKMAALQHPDWLVHFYMGQAEKKKKNKKTTQEPKEQKEPEPELKSSQPKKPVQPESPPKAQKPSQPKQPVPESPSKAKKRKAEETAVKPAVAATNGKAHKTENGAVASEAQKKAAATESQFNKPKPAKAEASSPSKTVSSPVKPRSSNPYDDDDD